MAAVFFINYTCHLWDMTPVFAGPRLSREASPRQYNCASDGLDSKIRAQSSIQPAFKEDTCSIISGMPATPQGGRVKGYGRVPWI